MFLKGLAVKTAASLVPSLLFPSKLAPLALSFSLFLILYFSVSLFHLNSASFFTLFALWLWLRTTYPKRNGFWASGLLSGKRQANGQGGRAGGLPRLSCPSPQQMWNHCWYHCFVGQLSLSLRQIVSSCAINTAKYSKYVRWEIVQNIWNVAVPLHGIWAIFCWKLTRNTLERNVMLSNH